MTPEQQIELINAMIQENTDVTIKDYLEAKKEIERIEMATSNFFTPGFAKINRMLKQTKENVKAA